MYYNLIFTKTYATAPNVIVSYWNNNIDAYGWIRFSVGNITTTGCTIYCDTDVHTISALGCQYTVVGI